MYGDFTMGGFGGGFMWLFWILLIAVVVWAARGFDSGKSRQPSARELLDARYARGEIDEDEYRRRRNNLD